MILTTLQATNFTLPIVVATSCVFLRATDTVALVTDIKKDHFYIDLEGIKGSHPTDGLSFIAVWPTSRAESTDVVEVTVNAVP